MIYIAQFIVGGTVMVLASILSQSKYLFLSGIITLLPILTLINMRLQMKNMTTETFHIVQVNAIYGAVGMILFTVLVYIFSGMYKPPIAVMSAVGIYAIFMLIGKPVLAWIQTII